MGAPSATNTVTSLTTLTFADLLRYHRTAANLTQEELAERAHLSVNAISTLERGVRRSPRKETVALLADALRLAPDDHAAFTAARRSPGPATLAATPGADLAHNGAADAAGNSLLEYQANVISQERRLVLARNSRFFSNFFHTPALDQITLETVWKWEWFLHPERKQVDRDAQLAAYRRGDLTVDDGLEALDLGVLGGIPQGEVVINPAPLIITMGFTQRSVAPSARANGGVPFLADRTVRSALVEAFDRCGAVKAVLGLRDCRDPNFHTDEHAALPSPDYDSSVMLPAYNPTDAAKLLDTAGYLVVAGIRRYRDGTTPLTLTVATISPGAEPSAGFFQRMRQDFARNLHIVVQIQQDTDDIDVTGAFDIAMWQEPVGPNPVDNLGGWLWNSVDIPSAKNSDGENFLGLIDPWIVAQDKRAAQTMDAGQRAEVYKGMVSHATEQIDYLPMLINADVALVKPTLCNFKQWSALGFYLWNMADWWVATDSKSCP